MCKNELNSNLNVNTENKKNDIIQSYYFSWVKRLGNYNAYDPIGEF